jgi:hypothetical protein
MDAIRYRSGTSQGQDFDQCRKTQTSASSFIYSFEPTSHLLTQLCQKLLEVAGGVAYLHHQNVVHGNLSGVRRFYCYYLLSDDDF